MLDKCLANVADVGPAIIQHLFNFCVCRDVIKYPVVAFAFFAGNGDCYRRNTQKHLPCLPQIIHNLYPCNSSDEGGQAMV